MLNQPERKPDYFIQIPPEVLFETKLSAGAKLFYGEVLFLTYTYGFCSQKNAYFAANQSPVTVGIKEDAVLAEYGTERA